MSTSDAPEDEQMAAPRRSPPAGTPLILQVSLLDPDEFYYDPFADLELGDFAAASAFFVSHGHVVVFYNCRDLQAFQDLFPQATIEYLLSLPSGLLAEGHKILNSQHEAYRQQVVRPSAIAPPRSIVARYVAAGFGAGGDGGPSPPTTTASLSSSSMRSGLLRSLSPYAVGIHSLLLFTHRGSHLRFRPHLAGQPPFALTLKRQYSSR